MSLANHYTCPTCQRVLRTGISLMPGQKIHCPACQTVFDPPAEGAVPPRRPAAPPPIPVSRDYHRRDDDSWEDHYSRGQRADDDDERPRPTRRKSGLAVILCCTSVVLLVGVFCITAFVWPGFLRSGMTTSEQLDSLLAHAPARSAVLVAVDLSGLEDRNKLEKVIKGLPAQLAGNIPPGLREVVRDADAVLVAFRNADNDRPDFLAVRTKTSFNPQKVRAALGAEAANIEGKPVYRLHEREFSLLAFPDPENRIMILGNMPSADFGLLLHADKTRLNAVSRAQIERVGASPVWCLVHLEGGARQRLVQQLGGAMGGIGAAGPPGIQLGDQQAALHRADALLVWVESGTKVSLHAGLTCPTDRDAALLRDGFDQTWRFAKPMLQMGINMGFNKFGPDLDFDQAELFRSVLNDMDRSFEVHNGGNFVYASVILSHGTTQQLAEMVRKNPPADLFLADRSAPRQLPAFVNGRAEVNGELRLNDPHDRVRARRRHQVYLCPMTAGRTYEINLRSGWDNFLRLEDAAGNHLLSDDGGGGGLNACIVFRADRNETFRIIVTSCGPDQSGPFTLIVQERNW
jgi:hypothetical protein